MKLSIPSTELRYYVTSQVKTFFPDRLPNEADIALYWDLALERTEFCFEKINSKYYWDGESVLFNHLNADHYAMFLYLLSNTLFRNNADVVLCTKIFQLNRYLHGIDVFYEVMLPDIFMFVHSVGTVLGRAKYSNYFLVYQRCNVGGSADQNNNIVYPVIKEHVTMHPGTSILGNCVVENNCTLAAGSLLLNKNLESCSLYIGNPRDNVIHKRDGHHYSWKFT